VTEFDTSWVEVVNRSEHPIYVRQVELAPRSGDRPTVLQLDEPFPIQIEAYSSRGFPCDVVDEELGRMGVHPGAGFVPRVVLADGRIFQSISRRSLDQDERKAIRVKVRDALRRASPAEADVDKRRQRQHP
jgi:hypothetical protein